jgi:hypothetical protein
MVPLLLAGDATLTSRLSVSDVVTVRVVQDEHDRRYGRGVAAVLSF